MIIEYHRPKDTGAALKLIARSSPPTYPLGGGSFLSQPRNEEFAVVDLQNLDLNQLGKNKNSLLIGATVTLQDFLEYLMDPETDFLKAKLELEKAIRHEASFNLRQVATIGGSVVSANGRSPFVTSLIALDAAAKVISLDGEIDQINLGDFFPLWKEIRNDKLIIEFEIPKNVNFVYQYVARSPADLPIVCCAVCQWPSGRTRGALGGYGDYPKLFFDGNGEEGIRDAAVVSYNQAEDVWASSDYRSEIAGVLAGRCISLLNV